MAYNDGEPAGCAVSSCSATSTARKPASDVRVTGQHILVVDDDEFMRRLIGAVLRAEGYSLTIATGGVEGLALAHQVNPDLVLLDCEMPDLHGHEVCRQLRADSRFDNVPVFFLTGSTSSSDKHKGFAVGGSDYITKPLDRTELLARIRVHLELARAQEQIRRQAAMLQETVTHQAGRLDQVKTGQERILQSSTFKEIKTAVRFMPAYEAGGDFYEMVRLSEDQFGFMVADVSGHDLGVAYLTGAMKALTASFTSEVMSVSETMMMLNGGLGRFLPPGQYVTACYAKLCTSVSQLEVISAGHPAPLFQNAGGAIEPIELTGDILGMHETVLCESATMPVQPEDRLFLYSDGLIEAWPDADGKDGSRTHGIARVCELIAAKRQQSLQTVVDSVVDQLLSENSGNVVDDVVLLGIEF
ncbi:MAG: PP2C family protein-serine/threonine phosphatase [Phycisphaerae bacterium]